jgi:hypothetical protein
MAFTYATSFSLSAHPLYPLSIIAATRGTIDVWAPLLAIADPGQNLGEGGGKRVALGLDLGKLHEQWRRGGTSGSARA